MTTAQDERPGRRRWMRDQNQIEAEDLLADGGFRGKDCVRIDTCHCGETVTVRGMVRSVTLRPKDAVPAFEIELYDGSGSVTVVWLGRRQILGIDPGRSMLVTGRLTGDTENPTIYNPRYELKPA